MVKKELQVLIHNFKCKKYNQCLLAKVNVNDDDCVFLVI